MEALADQMSVPSEKPLAYVPTLARIFFPTLDALGRFTVCEAESMPSEARQLLAHEKHMTVTVEAFHHCLVDVEVVDRRWDPPYYAREILLRRQTDRAVVQFGVVRIDFNFLDEATQAEIRSESTPLGRILIAHNILRRVRLLGLWRIEPGPELLRCFNLAEPRTIYGRSAVIDCNGQSAIELLEIIAPLET